MDSLVHVETGIGMNDAINNLEIIILPNPADQYLTVTYSSFSNLPFRIYNAVGQVVVQGELMNKVTRIDVSELVAGNYIFHVLNRQTNYTHKVLISR